MIASLSCLLMSWILDLYQSEISEQISNWNHYFYKLFILKKDSSFVENLTCLLETQLPSSPVSQKNDQQVECGICYAQCLPVDDELGDKSGSGTDYMCENISCHKAFHSICLGDWLRSITTTRQSFNVLFGNCPYCSEPVAVKINVAKQ
uniref:FANCL C-terminal domain-containing protein n=1 Tax=Cannabis sativa TaxID=3483 RepID=A0A803PDM9_CANSA